MTTMPLWLYLVRHPTSRVRAGSELGSVLDVCNEKFTTIEPRSDGF